MVKSVINLAVCAPDNHILYVSSKFPSGWGFFSVNIRTISKPASAEQLRFRSGYRNFTTAISESASLVAKLIFEFSVQDFRNHLTQ